MKQLLNNDEADYVRKTLENQKEVINKYLKDNKFDEDDEDYIDSVSELALIDDILGKLS